MRDPISLYTYRRFMHGVVAQVGVSCQSNRHSHRGTPGRIHFCQQRSKHVKPRSSSSGAGSPTTGRLGFYVGGCRAPWPACRTRSGGRGSLGLDRPTAPTVRRPCSLSLSRTGSLGPLVSPDFHNGTGRPCPNRPSAADLREVPDTAPRVFGLRGSLFPDGSTSLPSGIRTDPGTGSQSRLRRAFPPAALLRTGATSRRHTSHATLPDSVTLFEPAQCSTHSVACCSRAPQSGLAQIPPADSPPPRPR